MATIVKQEPGVPAPSASNNVAIKAEHPDASVGIKSDNPAEDDALYEDAGDLDMTHGTRGIWLVKLPKFLLESWSQLDLDEEITIGEIMVSSDERFRLKLSDGLEVHNELPTQYDMVLNNRQVTNTWVFTEKDMPGFDPSGGAGAGAGAGGKKATVVQQEGMPSMPARLLYGEKPKQSFADRNKGGGGGWKKGQSGGGQPPYMRKAIPKKTALVGTVVHEATVMTPENDAKYKKLMMEAQRKAIQPKKIMQVLSGPVGGNLLAPGTMGASTGNFDSFIKRTEPVRKPTDTKASRMEKSALLDALFGCFKEYTAWSIKGLKEKLQQPEAYLKEVLSEIAVLHKSGKFALKYTLKPEYVRAMPLEGGGGPVDAAPIGQGMGTKGETVEMDEDEDDDDDEVEMEDVL